MMVPVMKTNMVLKRIFVFKLFSAKLAVLRLIFCMHTLHMLLQISLNKNDKPFSKQIALLP